MVENNESAQKVPKKRRCRIVKVVLLIIGAAGLLGFFLLPVYLSSESGKELILSKVNDSIAGTVKISDLSIGWFRGIRLTDLSFADDGGFASVQVRKISTKPNYLALLGGNMAFADTVLDNPKVVITIKQDSLESKKTEAPSQPDSDGDGKQNEMAIALAALDLEINEGSATINMTGDDNTIRTLQFKNIESKLDIKKPPAESTFDISMDIADGDNRSNIIAKGMIKPAKGKGWSLKGTDGDFTIKADALELETIGAILALMGKDIQAAGTLNVDVVAKINDGRFERLTGGATLTGFKRDIGGKVASLDEAVEITADISSDKKQLRIDELSINSSFCKVKCTGGAQGVDYSVEADLASTQEFARQFADFGEYGVKGTIDAKGTAAFNEKEIGIQGNSIVKKFGLSKGKKSKTLTGDARLGFDLQIPKGKEIVNIKSLKLEAKEDFGQIEIIDSVASLSEKTKEQLSVDAKAAVDIAKIYPFIEMFTDSQIEAGGKMDAEVKIKKQRKGGHSIIAKSTIENLRLARDGKKPFEDKNVRLDIDMVLDAEEESIAINDMSLICSQIKITKGRFSKQNRRGQTTVSGSLDAEYDLEALSAAASVAIKQDLVMKGKRKSAVKFESKYPKDKPEEMAANLSANADFGFDSAELMGLNFAKMDTAIAVNKGVLKVEPFSVAVNEGEVNFACGADYHNEPVLLKTPKQMTIIDKVRVTDDMSNELLAYINPLFANQVGVNGISNFDCDKFVWPISKGTRSDIEIAGTIWIDDLRLKPLGVPSAILSNQGEFTLEKTYFELKDGLLKYDNMQLNVGDNPVNFSGRVDIVKETYVMQTTLPYTADGKTVHVGQEANNRLSTTIEGSIKDGLDWGKVFEEIGGELLKGQLNKAIKDKLGDYVDEDTKKIILEQLENLFK
jgi:hypothetical protein